MSLYTSIPSKSSITRKWRLFLLKNSTGFNRQGLVDFSNKCFIIVNSFCIWIPISSSLFLTILTANLWSDSLLMHTLATPCWPCIKIKFKWSLLRLKIHLYPRTCHQIISPHPYPYLTMLMNSETRRNTFYTVFDFHHSSKMPVHHLKR
jgi:hypothetical protein